MFKYSNVQIKVKAGTTMITPKELNREAKQARYVIIFFRSLFFRTSKIAKCDLYFVYENFEQERAV